MQNIVLVLNCLTCIYTITIWNYGMILIEKQDLLHPQVHMHQHYGLKGCLEVAKANWNIIPQRHMFILIDFLCEPVFVCTCVCIFVFILLPEVTF